MTARALVVVATSSKVTRRAPARDPLQILPLDSDETAAVNSNWTRSVVSDHDDGCNEPVILPFSFPWSPQNAESTVYLNPNGGIMFRERMSECCTATSGCSRCYFAIPGRCDFQTSYTDMIASLVTDLNPGSAADADITFASAANALAVNFSRVPYYFSSTPSPRPPPFSFLTTLLTSGDVRVRIYQWSDPNSVCCWTGPSVGTRTWLAGIRLPTDPLYSFSDTQYQNQWNTTEPGYYPPLSSVRTGNTVTYVRKPRPDFCVYPQYLPASPSASVELRLATGCSICKTCTIEAKIAENTPYEVTAACTYATVDRTLRCQFSPDAATPVNTTVSVSLIVNSESFHHEPIEFTFVSSDDSRLPSAALSIHTGMCSLCFGNTSMVCKPDCNGHIGGTAELDECDVCSGGTTGVLPNATKDCSGLCSGRFRIEEYVGVPTDRPPTLNASQCVCDDDYAACANDTLKRVDIAGGVPAGLAQFCVSPNITMNNGSTRVYISVGDYQLCGTTGGPCDVQCEFGGIFVSANWSAVNQTVQCVSPGSPLIQPPKTAQVVAVRLFVNGTAVPSNRLYYTYISANDTRSASAHLSDSPHARCFSCASLHPSFCYMDCNGTYQGTAVVDNCGVCTGGLTNRTFNADADCAGICGGDFRNSSIASGEASCFCTGPIESCADTGRRSITEVPGSGGTGLQPAQLLCMSPVLLPYNPSENDTLRIGTEGNLCPVGASNCTVQCKIGDNTVHGEYNRVGKYVQCQRVLRLEPAATGANATVVVRLIVNGQIVASRPNFITFVDSGSALLTGLARAASIVGLCERCHHVTNNETCFKDCEGVWLGPAVVDACGNCTGGGTGVLYNAETDCEGVCFGPFSTDSQTGECSCSYTTAAGRDECLAAAQRSVAAAGVLEQTLCGFPSVVPSSGAAVRVVGRELSGGGAPTAPLSLVLGAAISVPCTFDAESRSLTATLPALSTGQSVTRSARVAIGGVEVGPRVYFSYDGSVTGGSEFASIPPLSACGQCTKVAPNVCGVDCNGDAMGSASLDQCNRCVGGLTGRVAGEDADCKGICFGPFVKDVNGSGDCICDKKANPLLCLHYKRSDNDESHTDETYSDLDSYVVVALVITSTAIAVLVAWVVHRFATTGRLGNMAGLPFFEECSRGVQYAPLRRR